MYKVKDYINIDKEILGGNPVFKGTRVPVETSIPTSGKKYFVRRILARFSLSDERQSNCGH